MYITLRYEPSEYTGSMAVDGSSYKGTTAQYKQMWHYIMDRFKAQNVTNAARRVETAAELN